VITSQRAGHKKPAREIFEFALSLNSVASHEAVMVGDNLITDVAGARNASIDCAFFNPDKVPHQENMKFEIHSLNELHSLL
jgi:putative hydrolase of the HAD superfamily